MNTAKKSADGRKLRRAGLGAVLAAALGFTGWKLAVPTDIRPVSVRGRHNPAAGTEGRRLLGELAVRYGGRESHQKLVATRVEYTDAWASSLMRRVGSPWHEGERVRLTFANGTDNSRLDFLSGPRAGLSWGIQQWQTYEVRDGQRSFRNDKDIKFWLPTVEYFLEMPFRIGEAGIVEHAGQRTLGEHSYDLVYVTWGRAEPQRHIDQYVLWIRRADTVLEFAEYTVRDIAPFMVGCIHYEDLRQVSAIRVPHRMTLGDCPGKPGMLHRQTLQNVQFLPSLPSEELVPEPARRAEKDG
jgi:hypothetical protein